MEAGQPLPQGKSERWWGDLESRRRSWEVAQERATGETARQLDGVRASVAEIRDVLEALKPRTFAQPTLLLEDYLGFNLLGYGTRYYAVSQAVGPLDLDQVEEEGWLGYEQEGRGYVAPDFATLKAKLDDRQGRQLRHAGEQLAEQLQQVQRDMLAADAALREGLQGETGWREEQESRWRAWAVAQEARSLELAGQLALLQKCVAELQATPWRRLRRRLRSGHGSGGKKA